MTKQKIINLFKLKDAQVKKIDSYIKELTEENRTKNLVGRSTLVEPWDRHICDSLQLIKYIKNKQSKILDMGTGAGLPGIILSILGYDNLTLVESKNKKTEFIKSFSNKTNLNPKIITSRIENMKPKTFEYITARALTSLDKLLNYSLFFSNDKTTLIFLKGRNVNNELIEAKKKYVFNFELFNSLSSGGGFVLKIMNVKKK